MKLGQWHRLVSLGCSLLFTVLILCSCDTSTSSDQITQASVTPKATPHGPTILGGNISDFLIKFGPPTNRSTPAYGDYHFQQYPGSTEDFLLVGTDIADGGMYKTRVASIIAQAPPNAQWDKATAESICTSFMPQDTHYKRQVTLKNSLGHILGVDKIYYSASLASKFKASLFKDDQGNKVTAGLFDIQYLFDAQLSLWGSCSITPGTQGTQQF